MSTAKKLLSILAMPAAFAVAFALAFLVMGAADAFAQPAEDPGTETGAAGDKPAYGYAPPSDEVPPTETDPEGEGQHPHDAATGEHAVGSADGEHAGAHHGDPTKHFNFFNFSYRGKDVVGGKFGDGQNLDPATGATVPGEEEPMSAPFVLMILNFVILMWILVWKGKPAAQKLAAERHDQIKTALDEAAKLRQQAEDKLHEYERRLEDADSEIKKLVDGIRADAESDKARILDNAAKQAVVMKRDAELRIAAEIELARAQLTREITSAASVATEKILREKMMPADQQQLVSSFIADVKAEQSQARAKEQP